MSVGDGAADGAFVDMQVDLCRGDGAVAEKLLDEFDVGAFFQKKGCEGVADHVGRHMFIYAGKIGILSEQKADALG